MPDPDRAETLLLGTAVHESAGLMFIRQVGPHRQDLKNGAYGIFQVEEATYRDNLHRFIGKHINGNYYGLMMSLVQRRFDLKFPPVDHVMVDWSWAVAVARIHYLLVPRRIPESLEAMANYYKQYYNSNLGKATPQDWLRNYQRYAAETPGDFL